MKLSSLAFQHEDTIPERYTCAGSDISPPLQISDIPEGTVSLVLVMDDPDAPGGVWDHWVAFDVAPLDAIDEAVGTLGTPGTNSWGRTGYGGPWEHPAPTRGDEPDTADPARLRERIATTSPSTRSIRASGYRWEQTRPKSWKRSPGTCSPRQR